MNIVNFLFQFIFNHLLFFNSINWIRYTIYISALDKKIASRHIWEIESDIIYVYIYRLITKMVLPDGSKNKRSIGHIANMKNQFLYLYRMF